ncbi:hypothetical protein L1049_008770 [Liquidambar formosana]|uniref:Non-haem dioxygenase N-terminal domain-containing protein n=1 Tax=Liquidambar formosana TaxID=63359 RepID=A0AAP0SB90_LIQFO
MVNCLQNWPEPIIRVQSLSDSGINAIPERYIKRPSERPFLNDASEDSSQVNIPLIDLQNAFDEATLREVSDACRKWGFFQIVNHGVSSELMKRTREIWRDFFHLPAEVKQEYANSPTTYEGYGSRLGVEKGAILDWSDYFFLHYFPTSLRDQNKWPRLPPSGRESIAKYGDELVKLCGILMKILSINLGLTEDHLQKAIGGEDIGACLRVNFLPKVSTTGPYPWSLPSLGPWCSHPSPP